MSRLQAQLSAAAHKAQAELATAAKHAKHCKDQVISLQSQLNSMSQVAQAEPRKLHQQLTEAQADADLCWQTLGMPEPCWSSVS